MIRQLLCNVLVSWQLSNRQMSRGWPLGTDSLRFAKGHVEYVGGDIKERKDNLAVNKTAHFSHN